MARRTHSGLRTTDTEVDDRVSEQIHPPHQTLFNAVTVVNVDLANRVALAPMNLGL